MNYLRFATFMLLAVSLSTALAHFLEMPAKLNYDGALWLHLLQTLYRLYGLISGIGEIGAVISTALLYVASRQRPASGRWALVAAILMAIAHGVFWIWVYPVNIELVPLTADTLPQDWPRLRNQWEYAHAIRALSQVLAFAALVISVLVEIPERMEFVRGKGGR